VGSPGRRLLVLLIAFAVSVMLRPREVAAADGPTSVSCGQSDDVVMHNPRRPALVRQHAGGDLDHPDRDFDGADPGVLLEWCEPGGPGAAAMPHLGHARTLACSRRHWHPPGRGPPAR
jgi:hypothetical protein